VKTDKKIVTRVFTTWLEDGVCRTKVKQAAVIELNDAIENSKTVIELSAGELYPLLVDLREINSIDKEARDHFSMKGRKPGVLAIAMLVKSPVSSIIGNFFLGLNKPTVPTHLFTSEAKALQWLEEFIPN
jgi:hypothetical protein